MLTVKGEVERLLAQMIEAAQNQPQALRQTIGICSVVRDMKLPDDGSITPELIPLTAQAALIRAWREYGEKVV